MPTAKPTHSKQANKTLTSFLPIKLNVVTSYFGFRNKTVTFITFRLKSCK